MKLSDMMCSICGVGPATGDSLFRNSPKGQKPTDWRCSAHLEAKVPEEVAQIVELVERLEPK